MTETNNKYLFALGLVTLVAVGVLVRMVVLFGALPTSFGSGTNHYTITFNDAPGVTVDTPVRRSGVRIGRVETVILNDETGEVRIGIAVDKQHTIRRNVQPVINTGLLASDTSIDFVPIDTPEPLRPSLLPPPQVPERPRDKPLDKGAGAEEQEQADPVPDSAPLPPGSDIRGRQAAEIRNLLNRTSELVPETRLVLNDIRRSLQMLDKLTPIVDETLREYRDLARDARRTLPEVRKTNEEIQGLVVEARKAFPDLNRTNDEIQGLAQDVRKAIPDVRRTNDELYGMLKDVRTALPDVQRTNDEIQVAAKNFGRVGERVDVLLQTNQDKIVKIIDNLNESLGRVVTTLSDENQKNLAVTLKNLRVASEPLPNTTKNFDALVKDGRESLTQIRETLKRADDVATDVQKAVRPLADRSEPLSKNALEATEKLNRLLDGVSTQFTAFTTGDSTIRRLLNDPTLINNLNEAVCELARAMPRIDRILKDVEVFADKIARHPEVLGARGAVAPSQGLKESPSTPPSGSEHPGWIRPFTPRQ